jgi:hypothetical protein
VSHFLGSLVAPTTSASPVSPVKGQMYFDTADDLLLYFDGSGWVASTEGPAGADGQTGADGSPGADGAKGNTGNTGTTGSTGPQGPSGQTGADGPEGPPGAVAESGVRAYASSNIDITTTSQQIYFDTAEWDDEGTYDTSFGRWQPQPGRYLVNARITLKGTISEATSRNGTVYLYEGTRLTRVGESLTYEGGTSSNVALGTQLTAMIETRAAETFTLKFISNLSGNQIQSGNIASFFEVARLA